MQTFTIEFHGLCPKTHKRVTMALRVQARDWTAAIDKCKRKYRTLDQFLFPVFNFNDRKRLPTRSLSARVARNAGPEEF